MNREFIYVGERYCFLGFLQEISHYFLRETFISMLSGRIEPLELTSQ